MESLALINSLWCFHRFNTSHLNQQSVLISLQEDWFSHSVKFLPLWNITRHEVMSALISAAHLHLVGIFSGNPYWLNYLPRLHQQNTVRKWLNQLNILKLCAAFSDPETKFQVLTRTVWTRLNSSATIFRYTLVEIKQLTRSHHYCGKILDMSHSFGSFWDH